MRVVCLNLLALALVFGLVAAVKAEDKDKEVTLKGSVTCAKCDLKLEKACATVIKVKKGDKDIVYYFDKDSAKKYHKDICTEAKDGEVTGTLSKDGKKNIVKVSKVEYK